MGYKYVGKLLGFSGMMILSIINYGQTGAAGVGNSSTNVIWVDANRLTLTNGTPVSSFTDVSGNGNNFAQSTSAKRPVYTTNVVNGLPALLYDGVDDELLTGSIASMVSSNVTYFIVFQRAQNIQQHMLGSNFVNETKKWMTYCNTGANTLISAQYSPTINHVSYTDPGAFTFTSTHITPTTMTLFKQGNQQMIKSATYTTPTGAHVKTVLGNASYSVSSNCTLNGYIAEVIIYNTALNTLQRRLVENYLGAKYNMAVPTDLYAYESTHNMGLVALGNDGTNSQTSARGAGVLQLSNAASLGSGDYLLCAHTNVALTNFTTSDIPSSIPTHSRWTRTWRADETLDVGTTDITFYLSGGNNFGDPATYRLLVDADGNFSDATIITGTYDSGTQTITFNTDLADGDYFTLAGADQVTEIHAILTGNWSDINTWDCSCIPNSASNVYIDAGVSVTVDVDAEAGYLSVGDPGGALIMNADFTLSVYENFDLLGGATLTDGEIAFVGPADQYLDPGGNVLTFNDLRINKTGTLTLYQSTYALNGTLFPDEGSMVLDPLATFTFTSTSATGGGRIDVVPSGFTFTGDYTVERFIPSGTTDWRNVCSPLTDGTLAEWDDDAFISGTGFPDGCAEGSGTCFHSCRFWQNSISYNVTSIDAALVRGRGYELYLGDDFYTFNGTTLDMTGNIESSTSVPMSLNTGWHTVGNPFISSMLYSATSRPSQISNYFYVYDASIGDYQWYDGASGLGSIPELDNGLMTTGQAVWVYATSLGTLTFEQSNKTASAGTYIRSAGTGDNSLVLYLLEDGSTYHSSISLVESADASDQLDSLMDFRQLTTGTEAAPGFSFMADGEQIRRNFINDDLRNKSFSLYTNIKNPGYYTIEASNIENFNNYQGIVLYDAQTGEFINLKEKISYVFYSDVYSGERFTLILTNEAMAEEPTVQSLTLNEQLSDQVSIIQMGHTLNISSTYDFTGESQVTLYDVLGQQEVHFGSVKLIQGSNLITIPEQHKGVYILSVSNGDELITKKIVL